MLSALKGGTLWAALAIILAVIGAVTYLTANGNITGADALIVITAIVTAVTGVTSAHVAGQTAAAAFNTPPPGPSAYPAAVAPVAVPQTATSAMPQ